MPKHGFNILIFWGFTKTFVPSISEILSNTRRKGRSYNFSVRINCFLEEASFSEFFKQQGSDSERANLQARAFAIILLLEEMRLHRNETYFEVTFAQHFIPDGDQVEKLLRYETATERSLDRALNRLERLQRRRLGERVLPSMRPHMTQ